jgi:hypothetical protein
LRSSTPTEEITMKFRSVAAAAMTACVVASASPAVAGTTVPGHDPENKPSKVDTDGNGAPDAGVFVNGRYDSLYAYDGNGDYYWDLGDGRTQGTVGSVDELDQETLTTCDYVNIYRADFGNDPFMDQGWIQNLINCQGVDEGHYAYLIVSEDDPRYTGNPEWSVWGTWEYVGYNVSGEGNLVKAGPQNHVG